MCLSNATPSCYVPVDYHERCLLILDARAGVSDSLYLLFLFTLAADRIRLYAERLSKRNFVERNSRLSTWLATHEPIRVLGPLERLCVYLLTTTVAAMHVLDKSTQP